MIEKCWAKLHGSYCQIEAGLCQEILHDLTGAPTRAFLIEKNEIFMKNIWKYLKEAQTNDFIMTVLS